MGFLIKEVTQNTISSKKEINKEKTIAITYSSPSLLPFEFSSVVVLI